MNRYNVLPLFRQGVFHGKNANIHLFLCGQEVYFHDQRYDAGQPAEAAACLCCAADAGQPVPAVLQSGRYHHRGAVRGRGSAGSGRQRGRPELSGAGLCQRHCLRLFHPHLMDLRCPRPPRDAPLHRQYRVAVHRFCHGAYHRYGGNDPSGAGVDEHPGRYHRPCGYLYPHHFCRHPLHAAL